MLRYTWRATGPLPAVKHRYAHISSFIYFIKIDCSIFLELTVVLYQLLLLVTVLRALKQCFCHCDAVMVLI